MSKERRVQIGKDAGLNSSEKVAERARWLNYWAKILKDELCKIVPNTNCEELSVPIVTMEKMSIRVPGKLGTELDTGGIHKAVIINTEYLSLPDRVILEILTHQLVHHWQQALGKKPAKIINHNKQFVDVNEKFGIFVTPVLGNHYRHPNGRFVEVMYDHNVTRVEPPILPEDIGNNDWWNYLPGQEDGINRRGRSALVKWTCGCQVVRVGTEDFFARCTICHNKFNRSDIR